MIGEKEACGKWTKWSRNGKKRKIRLKKYVFGAAWGWWPPSLGDNKTNLYYNWEKGMFFMDGWKTLDGKISIHIITCSYKKKMYIRASIIDAGW